MSYDFFVLFPCENRTQIDQIVSGNNEYSVIKSIYTRIKLLSSCLIKEDEIKNYAKAGDKRRDGGYKSLVHSITHNAATYTSQMIESEINSLKSIRIFSPTPQVLSNLTPFSVFIQFSFTLVKPYLSRDDEDFYIIDNPVRKDKVFKIPMVASSSWKGNLRFVMRTIIGGNDNDPRIVRLFGNEKGIEKNENFRMGRLNFYSTFFDAADLEVINPHDRRTRAGTQPIYIESVPIGAKGTFNLLYVPFDVIGDDHRLRAEVTEDLRLLNDGIREM